VSVPAAVRTTPAAPQDGSESSVPTGASAAPEVNADPTQVSGAAGEEQETRGPDYIREAFNRLRGYTQSATPQAPPVSTEQVPEPERSVESSFEVQPSAEADGTPATTLPRRREKQTPTANRPDQITLTQDEFRRRVQSEADRILAKQRADDEARREREQEQELRDNNPWEYVQKLKEKEAEAEEARRKTAEVTQTLDQQIHLYDRAILDTFVGQLPVEARRRVIESVTEDGIPGRTKVAQGALKALREQWLQEGARTARSRLANDQSFVKEILARYGGGRVEPDTTPSLPVSAAPRPVDESASMNSFMRAGAGALRQTPGR
jgi:hypothetical protein